MTKNFRGSFSYREICEIEVEWYRTRGKHRDRITKDVYDNEYVIADYWWNKQNPSRIEHIKDRLDDHIYEKATGIKRYGLRDTRSKWQKDLRG